MIKCGEEGTAFPYISSYFHFLLAWKHVAHQQNFCTLYLAYAGEKVLEVLKL